MAHKANYYLLIGTFDVSSGLAAWIDDIRSHYPFDVLVVSGDELEVWTSAVPDVAYDFVISDGDSFPYTALMESLLRGLGPGVQAGPELLATMSLSMSLCRMMRSPTFNSVHIILAMNLRRASIGNTVLERSGIRSGRMIRLLKRTKIMTEPGVVEIRASESVTAALSEAGKLASLHGRPAVADEIELLTGLVRQNRSGAVKILQAASVDMDTLLAELLSARDSGPLVLRTPDLWALAALKSDVT